MKIVIIGATGFVGSALLKEALKRGHKVTAVVSDTSKIQQSETLKAVSVDVQNSNSLAEIVRGHDAVISAFSGHAQPDILNYYVNGIKSIISAVKKASVPRLLIVGGAGTLEVAPGLQLIDTPQFPDGWKATAEGARQALKIFMSEKDLNWTILAPSAALEPGEQTGKFRLGTNQLLTDSSGNSRISLPDYAMAMIDELEKESHARSLFTVGY